MALLKQTQEKTDFQTYCRPPQFSTAAMSLSPNPAAEMMHYAQGRKDLISLGQGQSEFSTPDFICEATTRALHEGRTFYSQPLGFPELRQEISDYYKRIYGFNSIDPQRVFVTASGSTAMHIALKALVGKGDEVLAVTPIWKNLLGSIELTQAKIREVPLDYHDEKNEWQLDMDKLMNSVTERTRVILLVSPSNPTGWTATHEEIRTLLDFARERGIWIIADEVYSRLVYEDVRAPSFLDSARDDDLLLTVNSFSKTWAMTGWRMGWLVGPRIAEEKIKDIAMYNNLCLPSFTQFGAIAALEQGEEFLTKQLDLWRSNRDLVVERIAAMKGVRMAYPKATFYSFFKVDGAPDCIKFGRRLIDEGGVLLAPGISFGKGGEGYQRLCFAVSQERISKALDGIERVINCL